MDSRQQITKPETQADQDIIRNLNSENQVVTLDAIHCQKATVQNLINSNNDYLITVKNNQKTLRKTLHDLAITTPPLSQYIEYDKSRGRNIQRTVSVFSLPENIKSAWLNSQRFIQVTRIGTRKYKPIDQTVYYLSSRQSNAQTFAAKIRGHWLIENQLHWVKDAIFKEDKSPICHFQAVTNLSILLTIAINLFRILGFCSITNAQTWLYGRLWGLAPNSE
ncbi:MAG: ISAs1 family transposase [Coleofasciculus sp. E1-EBD-02]